MNGATDMGPQYLEKLRGEFDRAFALPPAEARDSRVPLAAVRSGGEPLALHLRQIAGMAGRRRVLSLPSRSPDLLGIAAIRGVLVPVYHLASLLGFPARRSESAWLALIQRDPPLALAFEEFEGQMDVAPSCIFAGGERDRRYICQIVKLGSAVRAVVDIPAIIESIQRAARRDV